MSCNVPVPIRRTFPKISCTNCITGCACRRRLRVSQPASPIAAYSKKEGGRRRHWTTREPCYSVGLPREKLISTLVLKGAYLHGQTRISCRNVLSKVGDRGRSVDGGRDAAALPQWSGHASSNVIMLLREPLPPPPRGVCPSRSERRSATTTSDTYDQCRFLPIPTI